VPNISPLIRLYVSCASFYVELLESATANRDKELIEHPHLGIA
jgi:hypothetical protein